MFLQVKFDSFRLTQFIKFDHGNALERDVYTGYHGKCKSYDFGDTLVPNRNMARFNVSSGNGELNVYFLEDAEDLIFFAVNLGTESVPTVTLETHTLVTLGQGTWQYMSTPERECEEGQTNSKFKKCIVREINKLYTERGYQCAPVQFR